MILKDIYLYPELLDYGEEITYPFKELTRSLCNYLGRKVKEARCETAGFNRVCFVGRKEPSGEAYVNSSNVLGVEIFIDEDEYLNTTKEKLNKYFSKLIMDGLDKVDDKYSLPKDVIVNAISDFECSGFINEWVHKKKVFKKQNLVCSLICNHSINDFQLSLKVMRAGDVVFNEVILVTPPDELAYHYKFKDILMDDDEVIVTTKLHTEPDNVLFRLKLS
ncbi:hypothetical protein [Pectobacterium parmentieri]|uniref:Uncharacterized protein n=1 Tax=Pectobacterium parmentieri TaxID=1905730 RepID=A0A8B3FHS5_PECPM|nr:hypothetical protein [Pectobacterium parmentieri]AOR61172.1 hypothetical protein A8F97_20120 [Pectobacterium parmentieri]AYH12163.1 hypothetical protein C5E24_21950 [Pectobacterium parmentieri]AYH20877.1 hypothetical protein C5E22_21830 [Pectobacterium parmentieri]AYH38440.1 hypothetical protein C5E17_21675 [Pectobacterium parmentieri]AZS58667.1 hypothetical protein C5E18_22360 [Pectobacterium parmentieri]